MTEARDADSRSTVSIAVATAIHAAAIAGLLVVPTGRGDATAGRSVEQTEVAIEIDGESLPTAPAVPEARAAVVETSPVAARAAGLGAMRGAAGASSASSA